MVLLPRVVKIGLLPSQPHLMWRALCGLGEMGVDVLGRGAVFHKYCRYEEENSPPQGRKHLVGYVNVHHVV